MRLPVLGAGQAGEERRLKWGSHKNSKMRAENLFQNFRIVCMAAYSHGSIAKAAFQISLEGEEPKWGNAGKQALHHRMRHGQLAQPAVTMPA